MIRNSVVKQRSKDRKQNTKASIKIDVPFTHIEAERYRRFVTTRKAGQIVRELLIRAMDEADGVAASCGEARELATFIASMSPEQLRQIKFAKAEAQEVSEASA